MSKVIINTSTQMNEAIDKLMRDMGIPERLPGYKYIKTGAQLVLQDPTVTESITKLLYPDIAMVHQTTSIKVERSMRNAIEVTWEKGNAQLFHRMFGYSSEDDMFRPTNTKFMEGMYAYIIFLRKIGIIQDDYDPAA